MFKRFVQFWFALNFYTIRSLIQGSNNHTSMNKLSWNIFRKVCFLKNSKKKLIYVPLTVPKVYPWFPPALLYTIATKSLPMCLFFLLHFGSVLRSVGINVATTNRYVKNYFFEAISNFFSYEKQANKQMPTEQYLPWNITCIKSSSHIYAKSPSTSASRPPRKVVLRSTSKNSITNCKQAADKNQNCDGIIAYKYLPLRQINDPRPCKKSVYLREPKGFANIACSLFAWSGPTYKTPILCASCLKYGT